MSKGASCIFCDAFRILDTWRTFLKSVGGYILRLAGTNRSVSPPSWESSILKAELSTNLASCCSKKFEFSSCSWLWIVSPTFSMLYRVVFAVFCLRMSSFDLFWDICYERPKFVTLSLKLLVIANSFLYERSFYPGKFFKFSDSGRATCSLPRALGLSLLFHSVVAFIFGSCLGERDWLPFDGEFSTWYTSIG